jgi:flagellar basal-body rod modification protein FlgD
VNASDVGISDDSTAMPELEVELSGKVTSAEVIIRDSAGNEVRRLSLGPSPGGTVAAPWDGTDANGVKVPPGTYHLEVVAMSADGSAVTGQPQMRGVVDAIDFSSGAAFLRIGAAMIAPGDVVSIR